MIRSSGSGNTVDAVLPVCLLVCRLYCWRRSVAVEAPTGRDEINVALTLCRLFPTKVLIRQIVCCRRHGDNEGQSDGCSGLGGIYLTRCRRWIRQAATRFLGTSVDWKAPFHD